VGVRLPGVAGRGTGIFKERVEGLGIEFCISDTEDTCIGSGLMVIGGYIITPD
jgi:hypothetical protein